MKIQSKKPIKYKLIRIKNPVKKDDIYYCEGNINCSGEGSIYLNRENDFKTYLKLPPGEYNYKVFRNQYEFYDEQKELVRINGIYFNEKLSYNSNGIVIFFIYSDKPAQVSVIDDDHKNLRVKTIVRKYGLIYYFISEEGKKLRFYLNDSIYAINWKNGINTAKENDSQGSKIIYQIFPDRFFKYKQKKLKNIMRWDDSPDYKSFFGGNIKGITEKLNYIKDLNVEYIYINPIFKSHSNHRYDVDDYFTIDPILGNDQDLKKLISEAHGKGLKIILDMVFNHTSVYHPFFVDVLKYGQNSKYFNYYIFHNNNYKVFEGHCDFLNGDRECPPYETFMGYGRMPKLNHMNEDVTNYILNVIEYWMKTFDFDGIRYDVGNSLPKFLIEKLMRKYPKILHIGEVWCAAPIYSEKYYYDGITNYYLRDLIISLVEGKISTKKFVDIYYEFLFIYGTKVDKCMNILSSHDVERIRTHFLGDLNKTLLSYSILFMMNGFVTIYYGDEVGMEGGPDPDCRRTFPWNSYDKNILKFFQELGRIRGEREIMSSGLLVTNRRKDVKLISKVSKREKLNLYFSNKEVRIRIKGSILLGFNYSIQKNGEIKIKEEGFVLELSSNE